MPLTRIQCVDALMHVITQVLEEPEDGNIMRAIQNAGHIHVKDIMSLRKDDLSELKYYDDDGTI